MNGPIRTAAIALASERSVRMHDAPAQHFILPIKHIT
jgi:hypothetical protein